MTGIETYAFKALRVDGTVEEGAVDAPSRAAAVALVSASGALLTEISARGTEIPLRRRIPSADATAGLRAIATLLTSGIALGRALSILTDLAPRSWNGVIPGMRRRIEQGGSLADALSASSLRIPAPAIGVIRAGEVAGNLAAAVEQAAALLEARERTVSAIRSALSYPAMLAVAGSASAALLVGVVLPRFVDLLAEYQQQLPMTTRVVIGLADGVRALALPVIGLGGIAMTAAHRYISTRKGRARWHRWLLALPIAGPIRLSMATSYGCTTLAAMLRAGLPLARALPHAAAATGDAEIEDRLAAVNERIRRGESFGSALAAEGAMTSTALRLARVGEESANLAGMLSEAGKIESVHSLERIQRLVRYIEPTMILIFGGVVMLVAAALLQAVYGLRPVP